MRLSLVIPVFNEVESLPALRAAIGRALDAIDGDREILLVYDGSQDGSAEALDDWASGDQRARVRHFSRNFGHQAAITAGLDHAGGDAVVVMDADLQDPPDLLPEMVEYYRRGVDVVSARRVGREGEGAFKRGTAALFYGLMRRAVDERLQDQVGDFRLYSRAAVVALRGFREQHRFLRGLVSWLGLKEAVIPFRRPERAAGVTKYPAWKMARFAWIAISSCSALPLRLALGAGLALTGLGLAYSAWVLYESFVLRTTVPGWPSLVCLQLIFSGATLTAVGLVGDYVARIYEEVKGRPLYVVGATTNLPGTAPPPSRSVRIRPRAASPSGHSEGPPAPEPAFEPSEALR